MRGGSGSSEEVRERIGINVDSEERRVGPVRGDNVDGLPNFRGGQPISGGIKQDVDPSERGEGLDQRRILPKHRRVEIGGRAHGGGAGGIGVPVGCRAVCHEFKDIHVAEPDVLHRPSECALKIDNREVERRVGPRDAIHIDGTVVGECEDLNSIASNVARCGGTDQSGGGSVIEQQDIQVAGRSGSAGTREGFIPLKADGHRATHRHLDLLKRVNTRSRIEIVEGKRSAREIDAGINEPTQVFPRVLEVVSSR